MPGSAALSGAALSGAALSGAGPLRRAAAFACLLAVASAGAREARAQDDCVLDGCADKRHPPAARRTDRGEAPAFERARQRPRGGSRPGAFDFYVLSLSWSPGFCATGGEAKGRDQCRAGANLGFTVHGLWPQYEHGFPSDCRGASLPGRDPALRLTDGVYPDERLARYEWRRHGTCSGLSPAEYFGAAKAARDAVAIPPRFREPHEVQATAPADVEQAFTDANPRLRSGMVAAVCRDGTLDEVRLCLNRDLKDYRLCPEVVRGRCGSAQLSIPAVR